MHIRSFRYTPEMVDCRYCTEHTRKPPHCKLPRCPWIAERIEAGVVGYREAVSFYHRYNPKLRERLNSLVELDCVLMSQMQIGNVVNGHCATSFNDSLGYCSRAFMKWQMCGYLFFHKGSYKCETSAKPLAMRSFARYDITWSPGKNFCNIHSAETGIVCLPFSFSGSRREQRTRRRDGDKHRVR